ncbi:regulator of microtubule dynamics protein 2-like [Lethenteron reissneri]|uniref:regulator of microtubule dynamics protein 2-like n=1 Tax=Lethenteron reissneri TaxID=7753 RepID=UPI002AB60895|nr:regulator of microtubule dynamics protein 2-like [Lethenteron reissneri]
MMSSLQTVGVVAASGSSGGGGRTSLVLAFLAGAGAVTGAVGLGLGLSWIRRRDQGALGGGDRDDATGFFAMSPVSEAVAALLERQAQMAEQIVAVMHGMEGLREELSALLRDGLPAAVEEVRRRTESLAPPGGAWGGGRRRRGLPRRRNSDSDGSDSIYFGASNGGGAESEGGYATARGDSDDDEDNENSVPARCVTQASLVGGEAVKQEVEEGVNDAEVEAVVVPLDSTADEELMRLLVEADRLHSGDASSREEGFRVLDQQRGTYSNSAEFLWRLVRGYSDLFEMTTDTEQKKIYANAGKEVAVESIKVNEQSANCHQWYAVMCGFLADYETTQNRIKNGFLFKEHIDRAIELDPSDPLNYYLLGRWCYGVSQLTWIERKVAATLFAVTPMATIQDALDNFLKTEELKPKFSKANQVFIAKCYDQLGDSGNTLKWLNSASLMDSVTAEDEEATRDLEEMMKNFRV